MNHSYSKLLLRWLVRGCFGFLCGTCSLTPALAVVPQPYLQNPTSEAFLIAQSSFDESILPITTGQLDENSPTLPDGSYYQVHTFEGTAGERIVIELSSDEFDPYLILLSSGSEVVAKNNDGRLSTNSKIFVGLPTTGVYTIVVSAYGENKTGRYRIEKRAFTATDILLAEVEKLNQHVVELYQSGKYSEAILVAERSLSTFEQALGESHPEVAVDINNLAALYRNQGLYSEAESLFRRSLSIFEQVLGESHPEVATSLNNLALLYQDQGLYVEAEPLYQRSLVITEQALGESHLKVATSLNNLAGLYQAQGRYAEAEPLYQRSLSIFKQALGESHLKVATSLNNLAGLYQAQGRYAEAEPLYQRSLVIREQALEEGHPEVATGLNNLAGLYQAQGRYAEAEPLYQRSLVIREQALGADHPDVANSLNGLAVLYQLQGRYAETEPLYQRSLVIREQALGADHPDVANSLNNLAILYQLQGRYSEAEPLYQRSLSIREQALGDSHPEVATGLNNLAGLYQFQGRYSEAEPLYQRSLVINEKTLGESHPAFATSLYGLAALYQDQNRYDEAESLLQRSLSIREEVLDESHPEVATSLNRLAGLYQNQGRYLEAEPLYRRSLAINEETLGESHPEVATGLNNLARLYQDQGRYAEAEPLHQRSLSVSEEVLGDRHPDVANSLNNLAGLYQDQGRYAEAEPLYKRSISILEEALGDRHPDIAIGLTNLATLSWSQNDFAATLLLLHQSLSIEESNLNLNLVGGSEVDKRDFLRKFNGTTNAVIALHLQELNDSANASKLVLSTILQRKGRLLDLFANSQQTLREQLDSESQSVLTDLEMERTRLSTLFYNRPESLPLDEYRSEVSTLESQIQDLENKLSRRSSQFRTLNQPIDLPAIQALLPEESTLIELVRYQPFDPTIANDNQGSEARYAAYILQSDGDAGGINLGPVAEIDALIADLQRALRNPSFTIDEVKETAQALDARIMAPIRERIGKSSHLLLSPDGAFNLIPFETLVDENGDYLIENYTLTYLTSGRDLLRLQSTAADQTEPLLLANPIFEQPGNLKVVQTRYAGLRERNWTALSGTAQEADRIAAQFTQEVRNLQGPDATEASLKQADRPRFLHIATHGFFESTNSTEDVPTDNPLLRSGLVLSGVNVGESGTEEDGIVSALEVSSLNLLGTKLAVLSACETGLGDLSVGEGVYGLRRALVLAGSESQLISLWRVQDDTTRDLMVQYYQHLLSGMGRSEALRQTQLAMLEDEATAHPYYWAAFINSGDWTPITEEE